MLRPMVDIAIVIALAAGAFAGCLGPLHGGLAIGPAQLASVQKLAALNPALSMSADPTTLSELVTVAAKAPIPADQLAKYDAALGLYESSVRPALLTSKIAPAMLALGEHLPFIGQHLDFPTK